MSENGNYKCVSIFYVVWTKGSCVFAYMRKYEIYRTKSGVVLVNQVVLEQCAVELWLDNSAEQSLLSIFSLRYGGSSKSVHHSVSIYRTQEALFWYRLQRNPILVSWFILLKSNHLYQTNKTLIKKWVYIIIITNKLKNLNLCSELFHY